LVKKAQRRQFVKIWFEFMHQPSERTILITGCSSGIGEHCAKALKADGWRVFVTARKSEDIAALKLQGFETFYLDYTDEDSIYTCVEEVLAATGGTIDALFNNGAYAQAGAVEDVPTHILRAQFEANFFGWHTLTRAIVPVMRKQGHGRIVHCSSILGRVAMPFRGPYAATKFALEGLMLCLKLELSDTNITVSMIEPGAVKSKIATNALPHFENNIDIEASPHRDAYQAQLKRLRQGGSESRWKPGPEAVMKVLHHALNAKHPRAHYVVTITAKLGLLMQWALPRWLNYRLLAHRG
jgi:NAD(P)-dependent dehydrogenase (short-subunit alcohol dehydrogenase family)